MEREAIVAWLRIHDVVELGGAFADAIERGEHGALVYLSQRCRYIGILHPAPDYTRHEES